MFVKPLGSLLALAGAAVALVGCSTTFGAFKPNAHFVEPNSNVTSLGQVAAASPRKTRWMGIGLYFTPEEIRAVHRDALSQQEGATALINYSEDTTVTLYPFYLLTFITMQYRISGEAVRVDVGRQELR